MKRSLISSILLPLLLMALLVVGINVAQASPTEQESSTAVDGPEAAPLAQPWKVRIQQRLPIAVSIGNNAATTGTITAPVTATTPISAIQPISIVQPISMVLDLDISFMVTDTLTTTVPASITLRLADGFTVTVPINVTLMPVTQTVVVLTPQQAVTTTATLTDSQGITVTPPITTTDSITASDSITATDLLTATGELTATTDLTQTEVATPDTEPETAEPEEPATEEPAAEEPAAEEPAAEEPAVEESVAGEPAVEIPSVSATSTVTANLRSGPETTAPIVGRAGTGETIRLVATSEDGTWFLLTSGAWIFSELVDGAPADLPVATPELIEALEAGNFSETDAPSEPETAGPETAEPEPATTPPTGTGTVAPTVNVDANLRSGPATSFPVIGGTITGQEVNIIGINSTGEWYLLDNGGWVAIFLVDNAPTDVPIVPDDATPQNVGATTPQTPGAGNPILVPTPTPGNAGDAQGSAQTGTGTLGQAERVYLGEVTSILTRYDVNSEAIVDQIGTLGGDLALLQDTAWQNEIQSAANTLALSSQQVRRLEPPALFADAHLDLRSAAGSYDLVAELVGDALADSNPATFQQVLAELDFAGTLVQLARDKLSAAAQ